MDNTTKFWEAMENNNMTAEDVANLFVNWHGTQLITNDFLENVANEGYVIEGYEEEEEEEED